MHYILLVLEDSTKATMLHSNLPTTESYYALGWGTLCSINVLLYMKFIWLLISHTGQVDQISLENNHARLIQYGISDTKRQLPAIKGNTLRLTHPVLSSLVLTWFPSFWSYNSISSLGNFSFH